MTTPKLGLDEGLATDPDSPTAGPNWAQILLADRVRYDDVANYQLPASAGSGGDDSAAWEDTLGLAGDDGGGIIEYDRTLRLNNVPVAGSNVWVRKKGSGLLVKNGAGPLFAVQAGAHKVNLDIYVDGQADTYDGGAVSVAVDTDGLRIGGRIDNVRQHGVVFDDASGSLVSGLNGNIVGLDGRAGYKVVTDAAMAIGSDLLNSATAGFTAANEGQLVFVFGAGISGDALFSVILNVNSPTQAQLADVALATVSAAQADWHWPLVKLPNDALNPANRKFSLCEAEGTTLVDLGSSQDTLVGMCAMRQIYYSGVPKKPVVVLNRIGTTGGETKIRAWDGIFALNAHAGRIRLLNDANTQRNLVMGNNTVHGVINDKPDTNQAWGNRGPNKAGADDAVVSFTRGTGQTENIMEWRDADGTVLAFVDQYGRFGLARGVANSAVLLGSITTAMDWAIGNYAGALDFTDTSNGAVAVEIVRAPSDGATSLLLRRNKAGVFSLQPVTEGAADSGGAGYRVLRIPN